VVKRISLAASKADNSRGLFDDDSLFDDDPLFVFEYDGCSTIVFHSPQAEH